METSVHYSRFRWAVLGLIVIATICSAMITVSFAPLIGEIAADLHVNLGIASFGFMGLHMLLMAAACALSGVLIDRLGIFPVINAGMIIIIVSNALLPWLGHAYWPTVAIRLIEAIGCAPVFVAIGPAVARWFPPLEVGAALGLQSVAISFGIMLGLIAGPSLTLSAGSWQRGLAWISVGMSLAFIVVFATSLAARKYSPPALEPETSSSAIGISKLARTRPFLAGIVGLACGIWTQQAFNSLAPGYLAVAPPMGVGFGPLTAGKLMTTVLLAGIFSSLAGGVLVDKMCGGKARPVVLTGFALIAICLILLILPPVFSQRSALIVCLVLIGTGTPFINPVILGFAAKTFPSSVVGRVVGTWMSIAIFSGAAGVMVGSATLRSTGNYQLCMEIISAVAVVGFLAALFIYPAESSQTTTLESEYLIASTCCSETPNPLVPNSLRK
jgi:MFS family permease